MLDKLKQLTKDTAVYGISTIVGRFLNFLLVPFYTRIFLPADYGVVAQLYVFIAIMNIIMVYGMDSSYLKYAANCPGEEKKKNFSTPFLAITGSGIIFAAFIYLLRYPILDLLEVPYKYSYLILYLALILLFDAAAVVPFIKLRLERKAKKFALYKMINIFLTVGLNFFLIVKMRQGLTAVFISNLIASAVTFSLFILPIFQNITAGIDFALLKRYFKFGLPYLPAGLASMLVQGIDRPILTKLTDLKTAGIYNANYKLGIFMMLFVNMFQFAWQPFFLQNAEEKNAKQIFSKVLTYFTIAASVLLVFLSLFIGNLVQVGIHGWYLIGERYREGVDIVPVILLAYVFNGIYYIFSAGVYIKEKSLYAPIVTGVGALVNIVVNFALIPVMGMMGAAIATLASYFAMSAGYLMVTQKFYKTDYEYGKLAKIFSMVLVVGALFYSYKYYVKPIVTSWIGMDIGNYILLVKAGLALLFIAGIIFFVLDKEERSFIMKKAGIKFGNN